MWGCIVIINLVVTAGFLVRDISANGRELKCEHEVVNISCPSSERIRIKNAVFGREPSQEFCSREGMLNDVSRPCTSVKTLSTLNKRCHNQKECSFPVVRDTFGDRPCNESVSIYLNVLYKCESSDPIRRTTTIHTTVVSPVSSGPVVSEPDIISCRPCVGCISCLRCIRRNITWPETPAGKWALAQCPNNPEMNEARLKCGSKPVEWVGRPDLSRCVSSKVKKIQSQLKGDFSPNLIRNVASELVVVSQDTDTVTGGDLVGVVQILDKMVDQLGTRSINATNTPEVKELVKEISSAVMVVTSNVLREDHSSSWDDIPQTNWNTMATKMMSTLEASAFQMANTFDFSQQITSVNENLVVGMSVLEMGNDHEEFPEDAVFPILEDLKGSLWETTRNFFRLPGKSLNSLAENGRATVVFTFYNNLENFLLPDPANGQAFCSAMSQSNDCTAIINTKVISASINSRRLSENGIPLLEPVEFTLQHQQTENVSKPQCVFWQYKEGVDAGGRWMTDGCELISSNSTHTTCSCNHLTSFAVIMSPTSPEVTGANALALDVITYIGCSISIVCLFLSFLTFACFRSLQCDRTTIHKNLVLCLFIANMIFIIFIDFSQNKILCSVVAGFLHYFFLAVFCWMLVEGIQLYYLLVEVFEADKSHVLWFYLSAYGFPAVIVAVSAAVYHQGYGTAYYCWLTTEMGFIWAFLGPVIVIILANSVMLGVALRAMYRHSKSAAAWRMKEKTKAQQIRSWLKGSLVLVVLLGLTWAFGFLFVNQQTIAFAYIFTILNSLQGAFIFIFHCLLNDKVQAEYKRCVRNATCLPERFRVWYGGARLSYNQSGSSSQHGNRFTSHLRGSSQSTSTTKLNSSQKRPHSLLRPGGVEPVVVVSDSGIDDPSSFMESAQIHVEESEFDGGAQFSAIEGSIVDSDYVERIVQRNRTNEWTTEGEGCDHMTSIPSEAGKRKCSHQIPTEVQQHDGKKQTVISQAGSFPGSDAASVQQHKPTGRISGRPSRTSHGIECSTSQDDKASSAKRILKVGQCEGVASPEGQPLEYPFNNLGMNFSHHNRHSGDFPENGNHVEQGKETTSYSLLSGSPRNNIRVHLTTGV